MQDYYASLSEDYDVKIRQLVPGYDEMVVCVVDHLKGVRPFAILEIGAGVGNLTEMVVQTMGCGSLTAVEISDEMVALAGRRLGSDDRVRIVQCDILDFVPDTSYDAIYSNLVLHNVSYDDKLDLLRRILAWLEPNGIFIWGDLIRHDDSGMQSAWVQARVEYAKETGCSEGLIEQNFAKEGTVDFPLTKEEMIDAARDAGFANVRVVWASDAFAVFLLDSRQRPTDEESNG